MKIQKILFALVVWTFLFSLKTAYSQAYVIDGVAAVVGNEIIMLSDIENQYDQMKAQGMPLPIDARCQILEQLLVQKLIVNQAKLDSVLVSDASVEQQLSSRLDYFINIIGSQKELENYFGKTILQIREDFRELIRDQMLVEKVQDNVTSDVRITPSEVKEYYKGMNKDSIPVIDGTVELEQIEKYPKNSEAAILKVKEQLLDMRKKILEGSSFATQAVLYSQDPGTAKKGGETGFLSKAELDPEYAKVAFSLKEGQISKIVQSEFGYHIIQLIERKGDRINTRHILLKPEVDPKALDNAKLKLDSVERLIRSDSIQFKVAALYFSDDKDSYLNGGLVINQKTNTSSFKMDDLPQDEYYIIKNLQPGEVSEPFLTKDEKGNPVYKIIRLKARTSPHTANLKEDYQFLQERALSEKRSRVMDDWIKEKQQATPYHIDSSFDKCNLASQGWVKH